MVSAVGSVECAVFRFGATEVAAVILGRIDVPPFWFACFRWRVLTAGFSDNKDEVTTGRRSAGCTVDTSCGILNQEFERIELYRTRMR